MLGNLEEMLGFYKFLIISYILLSANLGLALQIFQCIEGLVVMLNVRVVVEMHSVMIILKLAISCLTTVQYLPWKEFSF